MQSEQKTLASLPDIVAGFNFLLPKGLTAYTRRQSYGDFGEFGPVYRRGNIIARTFFPDTGAAIGRNMVINEGDRDVDYIRGHETKHFLQQRRLGFGGFYARILREYINPGYRASMRSPGYLEYEAHQYGKKYGTP